MPSPFFALSLLIALVGAETPPALSPVDLPPGASTLAGANRSVKSTRLGLAPVLSGGTLYVALQDRIVALDATSGARKGSVALEYPGEIIPGDGMIFVLAGNGTGPPYGNRRHEATDPSAQLGEVLARDGVVMPTTCPEHLSEVSRRYDSVRVRQAHVAADSASHLGGVRLV